MVFSKVVIAKKKKCYLSDTDIVVFSLEPPQSSRENYLLHTLFLPSHLARFFLFCGEKKEPLIWNQKDLVLNHKP